MASPPLIKVTGALAADICARVQLRKEALQLLREGMGPREFVDALLAKREYVPGIDFMAHALPPREGIWWGCLCVQHTYGEALTPADRAAAIAAVQWVLKPGEEARSAARRPAEAAGAASAAGSLAAAAFLSGGSVTLPNSPVSSPTPF